MTQLKLILTDHPGGKPVTALIALGLVIVAWTVAWTVASGLWMLIT